jgi:hypothetical protein
VIPGRIVALGLAALLLAGAGIAAAATHEDDEDTPTALEAPATTTSSILPDTTTTTVAETTTSMAPPTTVGRTTTTRRGATTTTRRPATTTTRPATTTTGPVGPCTAAQIEAVVTTDRESYGQDQQVNIRSLLRNRSSTPCIWSSYEFSATIRNPAGGTITSFSRRGDATGPTAFGPGQAHEASVSWDRISCAPPFCTQSPPGVYSVAVSWTFPGGPYVATRPFTLLA